VVTVSTVEDCRIGVRGLATGAGNSAESIRDELCDMDCDEISAEESEMAEPGGLACMQPQSGTPMTAKMIGTRFMAKESTLLPRKLQIGVLGPVRRPVRR